MFYRATAFSRDISEWDVNKVTDMRDMFSGVTLSTANYDALLREWSALPALQRDVEFGGGDNNYCNESARNILVNTYNWDIRDGGKDLDENCSLIDQEVFAFASTSLTKSTGDAAFTITPTGGSGTGGITYLSTDPGVASIAADSGEVTIAAGGTTTITATKAGDTIYNPATASYTLTIDNAIDYSNAFVTTWEVAAGGLGITIPTHWGFAYRYTVDWGDNSADTRVYTGDATHTYTTAGIYTVSISGTFPRIYFNNSGDRNKIKTIKQWGDNPWKSMNSAFYGCENLTIEATAGNPDLSNVTDMSKMFYRATIVNQGLSGWDVSNVTDMSKMFYRATIVNQGLSGWDVSNVTDMSKMFTHAEAFNQDLNRWDVSNVTSMRYMFHSATAFNQDLSGWDVSNVMDMRSMFYRAYAFNQNLNRWDVSKVTDMSYMFDGAVTFNGDISGWDVSSVVNMSRMFAFTDAFNQDLNRWDVSSVVDMYRMFDRAVTFNGDISGWDVSKVTDMALMFLGTAFNRDLSEWDVGKVTDMESMFGGATAFNQDISRWDVSKVTDMSYMFSLGATLSTENYDALLRGWSALPSLRGGIRFGGGNSNYCDESARNRLVNTYNWGITDGGKDLDENCLTDQAVFAFASTSLTKSTGDAAFTITPTGGSGTGGITYLSTDPRRGQHRRR